MRALAGLLLGIVAAAAAMMLVGFVGDLFFPTNVSTDPSSPGGVARLIQTASTGAQLFILLAWFAGALAGAAAAKAVAGASWPGWTIAGLLALLLAATFLAPLPAWMQIGAVLGPLAGGLIADVTVKGRAARPAQREAGDGSP